MSIKQTMSTPVAQDASSVAAVVNEATDGTKAVFTELATKLPDDSGFAQVSEENRLPVKGAPRNVKVAEVLSVSVSAGTTTAVVPAKDISGLSKVYYVCRASASHDFTVRIVAGGFGFSGVTIQSDEYKSAEDGFSRHIDAVGTTVAVEITNNSSASRTYSVYLGGVR